MAKNNIEEIEEQIKKLQEKKKCLIEKRKIEIADFIIKTWDLENESTETILGIIENTKPVKPIS